ncbi:MAG: hypothetical protein H6993_12700 [Pseudomonadales bacterium]|nr:hypothetical protein [Pseudomonadales bacterium]MCP5184817.1 hypothetical protein [Pseudomonadales bacterium]
MSQRLNNLRARFRSGFPSLWLAVMLSACAAPSIRVEGTFPVPLVNAYPVTVGWVLDEALTTYVHREKLDKGGDWVIDVGGVQKAMFDSLSRGLFTSHAFLDEPRAAAPVRGIFVPTIQELQFSTPKQTRSDYFEVWIKYSFKLYDPDGTLRGEFPITAYGKANTQNYSMNTTTGALQEAANAACRDAIAFFTLQFKAIPTIQAWLRDNGLEAT